MAARRNDTILAIEMVNSSNRRNTPNWSVEEARSYLHSDDENMRLQAVEKLIQELSYTDFIAACKPCLADSFWRIRGIVLHDIYDVLEAYHSKVECELKTDDEVREWIADLIESIAKLVADPNCAIAYAAAVVLELMGYYSNSSVGCAELIAALGDTRKRFAMDGSPISLSDDNTTVQFAAVNALGAFGQRAAAALPTLEKLSTSDDEQIRVASTATIAKIHESMSPGH